MFLNLIDRHFPRNVFEFSDENCNEIRGIAIGTTFTPPYAILFIAVLEEKILDKVKKKPSV